MRLPILILAFVFGTYAVSVEDPNVGVFAPTDKGTPGPQCGAAVDCGTCVAMHFCRWSRVSQVCKVRHHTTPDDNATSHCSPCVNCITPRTDTNIREADLVNVNDPHHVREEAEVFIRHGHPHRPYSSAEKRYVTPEIHDLPNNTSNITAPEPGHHHHHHRKFITPHYDEPHAKLEREHEEEEEEEEEESLKHHHKKFYSKHHPLRKAEEEEEEDEIEEATESHQPHHESHHALKEEEDEEEEEEEEEEEDEEIFKKRKKS